MSDTSPVSGAAPSAPSDSRAIPSILLPPQTETSWFPQEDTRAFLVDLHIDQIVAAITAGYGEYNLAEFFSQQLPAESAIRYRQEVFGDLETADLAERVTLFGESMRQLRHRLAQAGKLRSRYQRESWILDSAEIYCTATATLTSDLEKADLTSRGLNSLLVYLREYIDSAPFTAMVSDLRDVRERLAAVVYTTRIRGQRITVARYDGESDYGDEVLATFERFKQGSATSHAGSFPEIPDMNHVEARILDLVGQLFPDTFHALAAFVATYSDAIDPVIAQFGREAQFFLAYLRHIAPLKTAGLQFCHPEVTRESKEVFAENTFDLALAGKLLGEQKPVVLNGFSLTAPERIIVVSGANQGGKTTFARTFGQLHFLASLGCPIPGSAARMFLFDHLFTHFEAEEDLTDLSGKLEEDLTRIQRILTRATGDSILITNEIFTSTTLRDARFLGTEVLRMVIDLDMLCVYVTFVDELTTIAPTIVSMVSTVNPEKPVERTYHVVRRPADGRAYAAAIAQRYGLDYTRLKARLHP